MDSNGDAVAFVNVSLTWPEVGRLFVRGLHPSEVNLRVDGITADGDALAVAPIPLDVLFFGIDTLELNDLFPVVGNNTIDMGTLYLAIDEQRNITIESPIVSMFSLGNSLSATVTSFGARLAELQLLSPDGDGTIPWNLPVNTTSLLAAMVDDFSCFESGSTASCGGSFNPSRKLLSALLSNVSRSLTGVDVEAVVESFLELVPKNLGSVCFGGGDGDGGGSLWTVYPPSGLESLASDPLVLQLETRLAAFFRLRTQQAMVNGRSVPVVPVHQPEYGPTSVVLVEDRVRFERGKGVQLTLNVTGGSVNSSGTFPLPSITIVDPNDPTKESESSPIVVSSFSFRRHGSDADQSNDVSVTDTTLAPALTEVMVELEAVAESSGTLVLSVFDGVTPAGFVALTFDANRIFDEVCTAPSSAVLAVYWVFLIFAVVVGGLTSYCLVPANRAKCANRCSIVTSACSRHSPVQSLEISDRRNRVAKARRPTEPVTVSNPLQRHPVPPPSTTTAKDSPHPPHHSPVQKERPKPLERAHMESASPPAQESASPQSAQGLPSPPGSHDSIRRDSDSDHSDSSITKGGGGGAGRALTHNPRLQSGRNQHFYTSASSALHRPRPKESSDILVAAAWGDIDILGRPSHKKLPSGENTAQQSSPPKPSSSGGGPAPKNPSPPTAASTSNSTPALPSTVEESTTPEKPVHQPRSSPLWQHALHTVTAAAQLGLVALLVGRGILCSDGTSLVVLALYLLGSTFSALYASLTQLFEERYCTRHCLTRSAVAFFDPSFLTAAPTIQPTPPTAESGTTPQNTTAPQNTTTPQNTTAPQNTTTTQNTTAPQNIPPRSPQTLCSLDTASFALAVRTVPVVILTMSLLSRPLVNDVVVTLLVVVLALTVGQVTYVLAQRPRTRPFHLSMCFHCSVVLHDGVAAHQVFPTSQTSTLPICCRHPCPPSSDTESVESEHDIVKFSDPTAPSFRDIWGDAGRGFLAPPIPLSKKPNAPSGAAAPELEQEEDSAKETDTAQPRPILASPRIDFRVT